MKVKGKSYKTVWMRGRSVFLIDQNRLPFHFDIFESKDYRQTRDAIKVMKVRGAGAIGVAAGFAMAQAFIEAPKAGFWKYIDKAMSEIESARPTAQNLFYAARRVYICAKKSKDPRGAAVKESHAIAEQDDRGCKKIGVFGASLIKDGASIETHCNAGWLAFIDHGTALAPVYAAVAAGKKIFVYVDETRPRSQGALLTAWELYNEKIPHAIIPDNAGAHLMSTGKVDLMLVGADRIAPNGDVANKIGTLEKAVCAKEFNVPFYVAAPASTFDLDCKTGKDIPIEERAEEEVLYQSGMTEDGRLEKILVASPGSKAINPAFDVTPAKYITGIITEKGIIRADASSIKKLFR